MAKPRPPYQVYINRLDRLVRLRYEYRDELLPSGINLLDRAIRATKLDLEDAGAPLDAYLPMLQKLADRVWGGRL